MNKQHVRHPLLASLFKTWYFLALTIVSAVICVFALRANNEHMLHLKQALQTADQDNSNVTQALQELQAYVTTHMNTALTTGNTSVYPPIQLVNTYDRLVQAQSNLLQQQNSQIYTQAQDYCEKTYPSATLHTRVVCTEDYAASHGIKAAAPIPDSLYKFDFVSPRWSPDLAGWSMVVSIVSAAITAVLLVLRLLFKARVE